MARLTTKNVLTAACLLAVAWWFVVFFYGFWAFPDAPLRPCGDVFCGKTGHLRTATDYAAFRT